MMGGRWVHEIDYEDRPASLAAGDHRAARIGDWPVHGCRRWKKRGGSDDVTGGRPRAVPEPRDFYRRNTESPVRIHNMAPVRAGEREDFGIGDDRSRT